MVDVLRILGSVEIVVAALLANACVLAYHLLADWRRERLGPHLMAFMVAIAMVLDLSAVGQFAFRGSLWFAVLRLVTFTAIPIVIGWRLAIIIRTQTGVRRVRLARKPKTPGEGT